MSQSMSPKEYTKKIGRVTHKKIGSGSYSQVYESSKKYAVKIQATNEIVYIREIALLRYLNHPNIIRPEGQLFVKNADEIHLAMKRADSTLISLIGKFPSMEVITSITYQLLNALAHMEEKNVIHRDIKPGNILVYGNTVKICDFGLGKYFIDGKNSHTSHSGEVQTLWYRSPEVTLKRSYSLKTDVWSIGAIILEMAGNDQFQQQRDGFTYDAKEEEGNGDVTNEPKFVFKWFSYLLGDIPVDIEWDGDVKKEWFRKKSNLHKLCRFTNSTIVDLALKLLAWSPSDRLSAKEALKHKCFDGIEIPDIPMEIKTPIVWYDQKKSLQNDINYHHRHLLFGWMWDVVSDYKMYCQSPVLAYALVDLFLSRRLVMKQHLQLVGVTCLSIVNKVYEVVTYKYDDWSHVTNNIYGPIKVRNMEELILNEFNFDFLEIFHQILEHRFDQETWNIVSCLMSFDNPGSIDEVLSKTVEEKIELVQICKGSDDLKEKCLVTLFSQLGK